MIVAIASGATVLFAVLAAWIAWLSGRVGQLEKNQRQLEAEAKALRGAISAVCARESTADDRHRHLDRRLNHLAEQQERVLLRDPDAGPYQHALRLVERGATEAELMDACGLSRGEAALILSLHARAPDHSWLPESAAEVDDVRAPGAGSPGRRPLSR